MMPWLMLALALLLGGCDHMEVWKSERERDSRANTTYPDNYKADILAFMRTYLNDPTKVRDAYVSEPALRKIDEINRYSVCVRYNAKKIGGQYAGSKDAVAVFRSGRFDRLIDSRLERPTDKDRTPDPARELCKDAAFVPFPELQQMTR